MWRHFPHHTHARCGEISDFSTSFIWQNLKLLHMWRNFRFLHIYHAQKSDISPHEKIFSTHLISDISNKYQVWLGVATSEGGEGNPRQRGNSGTLEVATTQDHCKETFQQVQEIKREVNDSKQTFVDYSQSSKVLKLRQFKTILITHGGRVYERKLGNYMVIDMQTAGFLSDISLLDHL